MDINKKADIYVSYRMKTGVFRMYENFKIIKVYIDLDIHMYKIHILTDSNIQKTYNVHITSLENTDSILRMNRNLILNNLLNK